MMIPTPCFFMPENTPAGGSRTLRPHKGPRS